MPSVSKVLGDLASSTGSISVAAGSNTAPAITTSGDTNTGIFFPAADTIAFAEGGAESMRIDSSGNVGIGTTSPDAKLSIKNPSVSGDQTIFTVIGATTAADLFLLKVNQTTDVMSLGTSFSSGALAFTTASGTERMRINSAGEVLIGKTTGALTSNGWALYPDEGSNYCFDMGGATNECFNYNNTGTGTYDVAFRYQATIKGYIRVNSTNTTYSTTSDYRLKENIAPMVGALEKVVQLKPVTYTWKADGSDGQGFIAHELQAVIPDAVVGEKDAVETYTDEEGNEQTRIKAQGIDTSFLVATLTAAIQEQQTIINDLKARVEALEAK
jgi:hypothetical protein